MCGDNNGKNTVWRVARPDRYRGLEIPNSATISDAQKCIAAHFTELTDTPFNLYPLQPLYEMPGPHGTTIKSFNRLPLFNKPLTTLTDADPQVGIGAYTDDEVKKTEERWAAQWASQETATAAASTATAAASTATAATSTATAATSTATAATSTATAATSTATAATTVTAKK